MDNRVKFRALAAASTAALLMALPASAAAYGVPGTADPFLSGMPNGSACCMGDTAPAESPIYAGAVTAGSTLTFTGVTGSVSYAGGVPSDPPDGDVGFRIDTATYEAGALAINNIAGYTNMPVDALVGVFLGPGNPNGNPAPAELDFTNISFASLSPGLQQIFFIGDGLTGTGSGSVQNFVVPTGATRLYLAVADGEGWYNNTGVIDVTVNGVGTGRSVPEPDSWVLMLVGLGGLGAALRSRRRAVSLA